MNLLRHLLEPWLLTSKRRFSLLIIGVIFISIVMVTISFTLYRTSGVAQIDMSQSRYQALRNKATTDDETQVFAASGAVDGATVRDFLSQYDALTGKVTPVKDFGNDALSDRSLGLEATAQPATSAPTF